MEMSRIEREKRVVAEIIATYCRRRHKESEGALCENCHDLLRYALLRLEHCPKGEDKTSCKKCDIHCYASSYQTRIREIMRYMGPRMLFINPRAAMQHLLDELS